MYEENERYSWSSLFIKIIIVIIFVLFTIWLLSLSTKNATKTLSNSLNVLTDRIYQENIDRMEKVGKSYFTTERLPEEVGDVATLTLADMYKENLILDVKDKNGKACSAKNSYVSIEKLENEYEMKTYLECGSKSVYLREIIGCYNYCDSDNCGKTTPTGTIEYQYSRNVGGTWTEWSNWSEWSKTSVTKNDYRDVETEIRSEEYTSDKTITTKTYVGDATCQKVSGYNYKKTANGLCYYSKTITDTLTPSCPNVSGYTYTGQSGSTCNYRKTTSANSCAQTSDGYTLVNQSGFTCNYRKTTSSEVCHDVIAGYKTVTSCSGCGTQDIPIYKKECKTSSSTVTKTTTVGCPTGYTKKDGTCYASTTKTPTCPTGYKLRNGICAKDTVSEIVKDAVCGNNGKMEDGKCYIYNTSNTPTKETRNVTYYRYRTREQIGGTAEYKWSTSNNDSSLLNAGYKLTGKTRGGK